MVSLRNSFLKIGEPKPGKSIPAIPSGFNSFPDSLKAAIEAMQSPSMESWSLVKMDELDNKVWTEECQGMTSDGNFWYVGSNSGKDSFDPETFEFIEHYRGVYKFKLDFIPVIHRSFSEEGHVGPPCVYDGKVYIPIGDGKPRVWLLDTNLMDQGIYELGRNGTTQNGNIPWCAINPWNGNLYSSIFGNNQGEDDDGDVDGLYVYDPDDNFNYKGYFPIGGGIIHRVQGGYFSRNGQLYLSVDTEPHEFGEIRAYSALNGSFLGSKHITYEDDMTYGELENTSIMHLIHSDGSASYVQVMVLDNDEILGREDDVYIYNFSVPDPEAI